MNRLRTAAGQQLAELAARVAEGQRLSRGRRYQRQGHVFDLEVAPGMVTGLVAGSRAEPYEVSIACRHANDNERRAAAAAATGAVPRVVDIAFTCICPDWGDPCKHGVAVMLAFAEAVDFDTSLLFTWRSIDDVVPPPPAGTESLEIHAPRAVDEAAAQPVPVSEIRAQLADVLDAADELVAPTDRRDPDPESGSTMSAAVEQFFHGAMPSGVEDLIGPIDELQLGAYDRVRIAIDEADAAAVFADALESIADHWLNR